MRVVLNGLFAAAIALSAGCVQPKPPPLNPEPDVVYYEPGLYPHLLCLADRVIVETPASLTQEARAQLWRDYHLRLDYEWIEPWAGFTYHELSAEPQTLIDKAVAWLGWRKRPGLPELVAQLNDDPRVNWAAPDLLCLTWDQAGQPDGADVSPGLPENCGVTFLDADYRQLGSGVEAWAAQEDLPDPLPDFEYYRLAPPTGEVVTWAPELAGSSKFADRYSKVYGTGQAASLAAYLAAGRPPLAPVTICVADTGIMLNHPDLAGRLHPNVIDANYRNVRIVGLSDRPAADQEVTKRESAQACGQPRSAIKGQPAGHGTAVAGVIARCTAGFGDPPAVRILAASLKSKRTYAISGLQITSPISSFIKLVSVLYREFPVGACAPAEGDTVQNIGDVRVVSVSASIPRAYFSDMEWNIVGELVNKATDSIRLDLQMNDRVYVFAAGNEMQAEPNRPCDEEYVLGVTATMPYDAGQAWQQAKYREGANMGQKCVAAPGYGIITSNIYPHPNLVYLPENEVRVWSRETTPARGGQWREQTNRFSATSAATPQVSALAALVYAQSSQRTYPNVIQIIEDSTQGRTVSAPYGTARGLISYPDALGDWHQH